MSQRGERLDLRRVEIDAERERSSDAVGAGRRSQGLRSGRK